MTPKKRALEVSAWINNSTYSAWFNKLYAIAMSCFEWINLPDSVNPRFLEMCLFWNGWGAYFNDPVMGDLFLPCATSGELDVYNQPITVTAYAPNYTADLDVNEFKLCYDNYTRFPLALTMKLAAQQLYEIDMTIQVNIKAQKTPILITTDEKTRLSLENIYMKYIGNQPVIFGTKGFDPNTFNVLNTNAPYVGDKLQILKAQIFAEAMNALGVEANPNIKLSNAIAPEIVNSMGGVEALRNSRLLPRKNFCKEVNARFGTNIDVTFNSNLMLSRLEEGESIGNIYNSNQEYM